MLDKLAQATTELDFLRAFDGMATKNAQLIRKVDQISRLSASASPYQLARILKDLKVYRQDNRKLDQAFYVEK